MSDLHTRLAARTQRLFHRHGVSYDRFSRVVAGRVYARIAADVVDRLDGERPGRLVDLGCGPGRLTLALAGRLPGAEVEGLDIAADMIHRARHNAAEAGHPDRPRFTVGDVADLPYRAGSVDVVVSSFSAHHWPDVGAALAEIGRVLRPGGRGWIYDVGPLPQTRHLYAAAEARFGSGAVARSVLPGGRLGFSLVVGIAIEPGEHQGAA